jgi:hypothetical protein
LRITFVDALKHSIALIEAPFARLWPDVNRSYDRARPVNLGSTANPQLRVRTSSFSRARQNLATVFAYFHS